MKSWKNWAQKQEFKGLIVLPDLVPLEKKFEPYNYCIM